MLLLQYYNWSTLQPTTQLDKIPNTYMQSFNLGRWHQKIKSFCILTKQETTKVAVMSAGTCKSFAPH